MVRFSMVRLSSVDIAALRAARFYHAVRRTTDGRSVQCCGIPAIVSSLMAFEVLHGALVCLGLFQ
jgi:hypothetical protein